VLEQLIAHVSALETRRLQMEKDVFDHPPADWSKFLQRCGEHTELSRQIDDLTKLIQGKEEAL